MKTLNRAACGLGGALTRMALTATLTVAGFSQASAWDDDFDTYATNSTIIGQGGWEGWDNNPAADATVVDTVSVSAPNSIRITGTTDAVRTYSGYTSGKWVYRTMQYVSSTSVGDNYFILMNKYIHGTHVNTDWSVQLQARASANTMTSMETAVAVPLVEDAWAEIRCEIDLDNNLVTIYYNGQLMTSHPWFATGGQAAIECVDLYSDNAGSLAYFDDMSLLPVSSSETLAPTSEAILLGAGSGGTLASWAADDNDARTVCKFFVPNATSPFVRVNLNYTTTKTSPTAVSFNVKVSTHTPGPQSITLLMQNKVNSAFVATSVNGAASINGTTYNGVPTGALADYVGGGGAMTGQIEIRQTGPSTALLPCSSFEFGQMVVTG